MYNNNSNIIAGGNKNSEKEKKNQGKETEGNLAVILGEAIREGQSEEVKLGEIL